MTTPTPPTLDTIRTALACIPPDLPRDEWARVGMALKSELGEAGFELFDTWSRGGESYAAKSTHDTWRSIKAGGAVGIGTLFRLAQQHGFKFEAVQTPASPPSAEELKARAEARRAAAAREQAERDTRQREAAAGAARLWTEASEVDAERAGYLVRKGCKPYGVRVNAAGAVLVPMRDATGELWNVQAIKPAKPADGGPDKLFLKGGRKSGLMHWCGTPEVAPVLLIAEGYATAASLHEATGRPVAVAFDAGNLAPVVRALRGRYAAARIVVCGDDDRATAARTGRNPGREKATEAAKLARGVAVFPEGLPDGGSDWNDLHQSAGLQVVREQVEAAIQAAQAPAAAQGQGQARKTQPAGRQRAARGAGDEAGDGAAGFDPFRFDEDGVWHEEREGGPVKVCGPLRVVALARDAHDSEAALVLQFDSRFKKSAQWLMPSAMLAGDGATFRAELLKRGFATPHDPKRRALLTGYLLSRQQRVSTLVRHTPRVGWYGRRYVLPDETLGETSSAAEGDQVIFHSEAGIEVNFGQRGDLRVWKADIARLCIGNSRMGFAVAAAFAGPLLAWAPIKGGGGLHYFGGTSTGKTTGLLAAASVWGKGTENDPESYMQKWRATSNGLEYQGEQHNDCTLILDELGQIDAIDAGPAAYMLADGMGKARSKAGGGLRHKPTWRLLFLSSGELTLAQHMEAAGKKMKGGQEVRLIPIPAEVSPGSCLETAHEFETGHELSEYVKQKAAVCYGTAGREWLLWLCKNTARLSARVSEHMAAFEARFVRDDSSGQVKRGARRFALVAAAGEMASAAGLTDWPAGEAMRQAGVMYQAWVDTRSGGLGTSDEAAMLRDMRMHFMTCGEMNYKVWGVVDADHVKAVPYMYGWRKPVKIDARNSAGDLVEEQAGSTFYVQKDAFEAVVCKGHNWRRCLEVLKARDLVIAEPSGRLAHRAYPPGEGEKGVTVYRVKSDVKDAAED